MKYNGIKEGDATDGFNEGVAPVAFFTQIFPDGKKQDLAYIQLTPGSFCKHPVQLTRNNIFYYACSVYRSQNFYYPPKGSYLYKIDMNTLSYREVSFCSFNYIKASCN